MFYILTCTFNGFVIKNYPVQQQSNVKNMYDEILNHLIKESAVIMNIDQLQIIQLSKKFHIRIAMYQYTTFSNIQLPPNKDFLLLC